MVHLINAHITVMAMRCALGSNYPAGDTVSFSAAHHEIGLIGGGCDARVRKSSFRIVV